MKTLSVVLLVIVACVLALMPEISALPPGVTAPPNNIPDDAPTLGVAADMKRYVSQGFTYNGKSVNVQPFFTPYKLQLSQVGQENIAKFKIFDFHGPDNIAHFEFDFGLEKGQYPHDSKIRIEWDRTETGEEKTTLVDPDHILDNVRIEKGVEKCKATGKNNCLVLTIYHTFREAPKHEIVATYMWNHQRNSWQNFFNHGIKVQGDSINPPEKFTGIFKGKIFSLTETKEGKAIDENGDLWSYDKGIWNKDFVEMPFKKDELQKAMTRNNNNFPNMIQNETKTAQIKLKEICEKCTDKNYAEIGKIKKMKIKGSVDKLKNPKITKIMKLQNQNATNYIDSLYKKMYPGKVFKEGLPILNPCIICPDSEDHLR